MSKEYTIVKTECFPNAFKIETKRRPGCDNGANNFYPTRSKAEAEINRRSNYNQAQLDRVKAVQQLSVNRRYPS